MNLHRSFSSTIGTSGRLALILAATIAQTLFGTPPQALSATSTQQATQPDISVSKYANQQQAAAGELTSFTLNWNNNSGVSATNLILTDTLPAGMTFDSAVPPPSAISGNKVVWNVGNVIPTQGNTIQLKVRIDAAAQPGIVLTNTLTASVNEVESNTANNTAQAPVTVIAATRNLVVSKGKPPFGSFPSPAVVGQETTYILGYYNIGTATASNIILTDTLPSQTTFVTSTFPQSLTVTGNRLVWTLGSLPPSQFGGGPFGSIQVTVRVTDTATPGTTITNTVTGTIAETDIDPANNVASYSEVIQAPVRDVSISESAGFGIYTPGSSVYFTLIAGNNSPANAPARNVVVTDTLPAGMEFVTTTLPVSFTQSGNQLIWQLGTLSPNVSNQSWSVQARILTNTLPNIVLTNTATIGTSDIDTNTLNDTAQASVTVVPSARDVKVSKQLPLNTPVFPGSLLTYAVSVNNLGNSPVTGVVLTDTLPFPASSLVSADGSYTLQGNNIVWNVGQLSPSPGCCVLFNVVLRIPVTSSFGTVFTNTATATLAEADINPSNNTAFVTSTVISPTVGLFITKMASTTTAARGDLVTYTIQYGFSASGPFGFNYEGNSDATGVLITDTIPAGMSYVSSTAPFTTSVSGTTVTWYVGSMIRYQSSAGGTFSVTARVNNDAVGGQVFNLATIGSNEFELSPANNTGTAPLTINAPSGTYGVVVSLPAAQTAKPGATITTTFIVTNTGNTTDIVTLSYSQTLGWTILASPPTSVTLAAGASTAVPIRLLVPASLAGRQTNQITLTARSQADGTKSSTQSTTVSAGMNKVELPIVLRQ